MEEEGGKNEERKSVSERESKRKKRDSKSDFAVHWCRWIIMKMKATETGSIREQRNGAETDNTVKGDAENERERHAEERKEGG